MQFCNSMKVTMVDTRSYGEEVPIERFVFVFLLDAGCEDMVGIGIGIIYTSRRDTHLTSYRLPVVDDRNG